MRLLPYDSFTIQTIEPLPAVLEKLNSHIEAPKLRWTFSRNHLPYEGTLNHSGFEIRRIIHYRNSFLPKIRGRFEPASPGTLVHITMGLHPFVTAFLLFWCSIWYSISIPFFLAGAFSGDVNPFLAFQFIGMPIVILFAFWCAFWYEANRSRWELTQIIHGEPLTTENKANSKGLWVIMIAVIIFWNGAFFYFLPSFQQNSSSIVEKSCSQASNPSPFCKFSVVHTFKEHPAVSALAMSNDSKTLISGGQDKALKIWNLQTGNLIKTLQSDSGTINTVAISSDNKIVVTGSGDRMVRIWDITQNKTPKILKGHSSDIRQVEISTDKKTIVSLSYNEIKVWDSTTGQLKMSLPNKVSPTEINIGPLTIENDSPRFYSLTLSPDGNKALVESGNKLILWDLVTNQQTELPKKWAFESIGTARISLDGQTLVTASSSSKPVNLKVWNLETKTVQASQSVIVSPTNSSLSSMALTQNHIIAGTQKGLTVWNLKTAELEAVLDQQYLSNFVTSADGKLLAGISWNSTNQNPQIQVLKRP